MDDPNLHAYPVYRETPSELIIPRYYGSNTLGKEEKNTLTSQKITTQFQGNLRELQINIVNKCLKHLREHGGGVLSVPCGAGKCLKRGTPVIMYDGSIKLIEDVKVGDKLMGDDSTPRQVLDLGRGQEEMFDIIPTKGDKYTVNRSHILSLKYN